MRKPFQGVLNIIRFNWHFYALTIAVIVLIIFTANWMDKSIQYLLYLFAAIVTLTVCISLLVSFYVYDLSGLYDFNFLTKMRVKEASTIVNINAGFDETSALLKSRFTNSQLIVLDFYDPIKHTEVSIKRARKAYPPYTGTLSVETNNLELQGGSVDKVFIVFAAHEIRNKKERVTFFKELGRVLKVEGQIIVTEHLRDASNFFAYNIGFLHFYSKKEWLSTFLLAGLRVKEEIKITPFIATFILEKNGNTH